MPPFALLAGYTVDLSGTDGKMRALRAVGVPYTAEEIGSARADGEAQGRAIAKNLQEDGAGGVGPTSEIVALIAYLQRLGVHPEPTPKAGAAVSVVQ
jgi:cbb3-type cytochrome oxidase cytochrome c subunit